MVAMKNVTLLAFLSTASAQVASQWAQCGGIAWTGPTVCAAGLDCVVQNSWIFQCLAKSTSTSQTTLTVQTVATTKYTTATTLTVQTVATTRYTTATTTKKSTTKSTTTAKVTTKKSTTTSKGTTSKSTSYKTTTSIKPQQTLNYLFTFGDSYSQTGFDLAGTKPSVGNQLGNPSFPGYTTSGGPNWIGYLVQSNSQWLSYNLASGGATTDALLVTPFAPTVLSFVDQVAQFTKNLAPAPTYAPWTAANSVFAVWIGVNDVGNAWYKPEWPTLSERIIARYFEQVQLLYNAGARKFAFLSVPPIERAPTNLLADAQTSNAIKAAVLRYNDLLTKARIAFVTAHPDVFAPVIDTLPKFNLVLNNPLAFGAPNASCYNADGVTCLWWNDYHPGLVLQKGVAYDFASFFGLQRP